MKRSSGNSRTINIVTLGCSKNTVDSEKLLKQIEAGGYSVIYDRDNYDSDTVIVNTCGFINDAREESIETILRYVNAQQSGRIRNLYVMGCLSERYMDAMKSEIPEVKKYFGVNDLSGILEELGITVRRDLLSDRKLTGPDHYAYLKISEGCDRTCAFCSIPLIRGRYISRPVEELTGEAEKLARSGVKELILIAQDLSYYGLDLYGRQMLPELVSRLCGIKSHEWIRLHYLYPSNFQREIILMMKEEPRICRYIDIPVQHISDRMLRLMRRSHGEGRQGNFLDGSGRNCPMPQ